jgi:hypothetical protein
MEVNIMRKAGKLLTVFGLSLASIVTAISMTAGQTDTGKVTLESKSVAIGIGVSWGDGVLEYQGKKYPFTVNGLSVLDLGISKVTARGDVAKLKKVEDFSGNYVAAGAGVTVGGGASAVVMKNQNGVEMTLTATTQGVKLALAAAGVDIKLKQ